MFKFIVATAILGYAFLGEPYQEYFAYTLVAITVLYATTFYWMCFELVTGLKNGQVTGDYHIADMATLRIIQWSLLATLFLANFQYVVFYAAPWIGIMTSVDALSLLVKYGIIEIRKK